MSFDVFLIESSATPPKAQFERQMIEAIRSTGAWVSDDGGEVRTTDGADFNLYGGMFSLHGLTLQTCRLIFAAAEKTNAYIVPTGVENAPSLKIKGTRGRPPKGLFPIKVVVDPRMLCSALQPDYEGWRGYADHVHGVINPPSGSH
jgi:hypothetical protein